MQSELSTSARTVRVAIAIERGRIGLKVNRARIVAVFGWCVLGMILGLGGRREWLVPVPVLVLGLAVAVALQLGHRATGRIATHLWLATPLLDLPMVEVVQSHFLDVSVRPVAVAIFTIAILCSLVFVSQLSFNLYGIAITLAGALVCAALLLHRAQLPLPNFLAATLLLSWAASVAAFSSTRAQELVVSIIRQQASRESELAALVEQRTLQLGEQNRQLESRSAELEHALTSLAAAQSDLVRAEKLASVATLVKGIAHELNNPINYITNNVEPLQRYVGYITEVASQLAKESGGSSALALRLDGKHDLTFVASDLRALTDDISEGARRARLIVGDLQDLTSVTMRGFEDVDLAVVARQTKSLFEPRLSPGLSIELNLESVPSVRARAGQLEQVLVNLVDNAVRAMEKPGVVSIELKNEAQSVVVVVRDQGRGMTEEDRRRACEPFFSTRPPGEGSGLGLAIVEQIIHAHGGTTAIESKSGVGTEVTIRVPVLKPET